MASSVSSERAFSQGGITISKRRSRLKGDIVEALQCVKCSIHHDLLFHEPGPSSLLEVEPDDDVEMESDTLPRDSDVDVKEEGWDTLFLQDDGDDHESEADVEMSSDEELYT
jgi:hypothetical protein